jgi:hypothetical protein
MTEEVSLIGIYRVAGEPDVHLIELNIKARHTEIPIGKFTQRQEGLHRDSWQAPFNEKYLNKEGDTITGDDFNAPQDIADTTRLTFFMYFLDFDQPLITPFGDIGMILPTQMPDRLSAIIEFEDPE